VFVTQKEVADLFSICSNYSLDFSSVIFSYIHASYLCFNKKLNITRPRLSYIKHVLPSFHARKEGYVRVTRVTVIWQVHNIQVSVKMLYIRCNKFRVQSPIGLRSC